MYAIKGHNMIVIIIIVAFITGVLNVRLLKFTNVKCKDLATSGGMTKYEYCHLKVIRRNYIELSLKVSLYQLPIKNITARLQCFQQRDGGYRPFRYNVFFDFCKLMAAPMYKLSFEKFIFDSIRSHSNFNHTCPWKEGFMILEKFGLDMNVIDFPVPSGTYRLDFTFFGYGIPRTLTQVFFEKVD